MSRNTLLYSPLSSRLKLLHRLWLCACAVSFWKDWREIRRCVFAVVLVVVSEVLTCLLCRVQQRVNLPVLTSLLGLSFCSQLLLWDIQGAWPNNVCHEEAGLPPPRLQSHDPYVNEMKQQQWNNIVTLMQQIIIYFSYFSCSSLLRFFCHRSPFTCVFIHSTHLQRTVKV